MDKVGEIANQVWYLLQQGGWVMLILFLMGQVGWFLVMERWWVYRQEAAAVQADEGVAARLERDLAAVRPQGVTAMKKKAREILAPGSHRLHKHLGTIAAIAAAAPMMGLAGTVGGVMATFDVITIYGIGNPAMMAGGIAEALMVTEAALVIALPLMILHDRLHARAEKIEGEWTQLATGLIRDAAPGAAVDVAIEHDEGMGNHGNTVRV